MRNFLRYIQIIVGTTTLENDKYNIDFQVNRSSSSGGNGANITLTYINEDTFNLFKKDEDIKIIAGYKEGIIGLVFSGTIDEIEKERDSINILATEDNTKIVNTVITESFTPGTKASDIIRKIIRDNNIDIGEINIPNDYRYWRGKYFTESFKDSLDKMAGDVNCIWYIKKDLIYFRPKEDIKEITYLNADSGLIEFNKTTDGYKIVTKLNHTLDEDVKVKVEYEKGKTINVIINTSSHYSGDFITECEASDE